MANRSGRTWRRWVAAVGLLATLATACGSSSNDGASEAQPAEAKAVVDRSASLRVALGFGWTTLDPHGGPSFNMNWQSPLYDTLLAFDQFSTKGPKVIPSLAKSWTTSADGLTVTFTLRDDVTFQDGARFDASVVKANIERAKKMAAAIALSKVQSVEAKDATHAVFHLSAREPALFNLMAITQTGGMIDPAAFGRDLTKEPAGSGPYELVSANSNGDTVYDRWDGYWNKKAAYAKRITITTVFDENAAVAGLRAGSYDVTGLVSPQNIAGIRQAPGFHVQLTPAQNQMGVSLNTTKAPFDDERVRKAVSLAFDRPLVAKQIMQSLAPPAYQVFYPGQLGHDKSLDKGGYDLEKAKQLIDEAGVTGTTVQFLTQAGFPLNSLGQYAQEQLGKIGLKVELTVVANSLFKITWAKGQHDGQVAAMGAGLDPNETLTLCCMRGGLADNLGTTPAPVQALIAKGADQPLGSDARARTYEEISKYYVEHPGNDIPLVGFWAAFAGRPNVIGTEQIQPVNGGRLLWTYVGIAKK